MERRVGEEGREGGRDEGHAHATIATY